MLIETPYKNGDVVAVKLTSGEEVIGKLENESAEYIKINKPTVFANTPKGTALVPFMQTMDLATNPSVPLRASSCIAVIKVAKELADVYIEGTSGIRLATPMESALFKGK